MFFACGHVLGLWACSWPVDMFAWPCYGHLPHGHDLHLQTRSKLFELRVQLVSFPLLEHQIGYLALVVLMVVVLSTCAQVAELLHICRKDGTSSSAAEVLHGYCTREKAKVCVFVCFWRLWLCV